MNIITPYKYDNNELMNSNNGQNHKHALKLNWKTHSAEKIQSVFNKLEKIDEAMLGSILSNAVYEKNLWIIENINSTLPEMSEFFKDAIKNNGQMYYLKVWNFIKNTCEKIPDHELKIPAKGVSTSSYNYEVSFSYRDGQYSAANGLAHACVLRSKNFEKPGYTLHLTFRGTEFSRLMEYIKGPYLDMSAYYENFKPLINYIREYVNNPLNKITELHVNGHSLGGAMVQEFLKDNSSENFEPIIKGFTFGSPGSEKKWYHKFATIAYHALGRGVDVPINPNSIPSNKDGRITQFYHSNDPIPLVGLLGYRKGGSIYKLLDVAYDESKKANLEKKILLEDIPAFGKLFTYFKEVIINKFNTKFHDSARYTMNLKNKIDYYYKEYDGISTMFNHTSIKNWKNWMKYEQKFNTLSFEYQKELELLIKKDEPMLNNDDINKKISDLRNRMKYDSDAEMILKKDKFTDSCFSYKSEMIMNSNREYFENATVVNQTLRVMKKLREKNSDTSAMKKLY